MTTVEIVLLSFYLEYLFYSLLFFFYYYLFILFSFFILNSCDYAKIMEIEQMVDSLKEILGGREEENYMSLIVLHSMVEKEDQMRAFEPLEPYVTRLVLSTNIAESSITLPMVRYVLDLGMHKQVGKMTKK